ncbi:MAG: hypothetical protein GXO76_03490 [Calditrichaeota bacterium]|nr:hypothetical protein [Calditrichota bacterium]
MATVQLILKLQNRIFLNWLRREFAGKTLVEIGFGAFLIGVTAFRFHQDIGFAWVHASSNEVAAVVQNSLFGLFFLASFFFQLTSVKAIRIPSGDALLSLPLREKDIYLFRANALLARIFPWFVAALFFWGIGWLRFPHTAPVWHLLQALALGLLLVLLAELVWTGVMIIQLLFEKVAPLARSLILFGVEILLFLILALSREASLFIFHPVFRVSPLFLAAAVLSGLTLFQINFILFKKILRREIHLRHKNPVKMKFLSHIANTLFGIFPPPLRSIIRLTIRSQFRTNSFFVGLLLIFVILLLIGFEISHSAVDFINNTLFGVLILEITLSAAFFGNQLEAQQEITFYKSQPLSFTKVWWGHTLGILIIYEMLTLLYLLFILVTFRPVSIPLWSINLLLLFPIFLSILQTNFYLTLLQNVKTGEYLYIAFWAMNWIFWFVFPFLPIFLLLAGVFSVKPARTLFEQVEESW